MLKKIIYTVRGAIVAILLALSTITVGLLILFFACFVFIVPAKRWRQAGMTFLLKFPVWWVDINNLIMKISTFGKWDISGEGQLSTKGLYILVSNHRSWIDILVIGAVFNRKSPVLKFFMKKELLWSLPVAGLVCYVLGFPFMSRHTRNELRKNPALKGKDIETTKKACKKIREFPTTLINFAEGTRFTELKKAKQQSPYDYLLKPKAGGTAVVIQELSQHLDGIINVTIDYHPHNINYWDFVCGKFTKIIVRYNVIPITTDLIGDYYQDRTFRAHFQQWLNQIWEQKDRLIDKLRNST